MEEFRNCYVTSQINPGRKGTDIQKKRRQIRANASATKDSLRKNLLKCNLLLAACTSMAFIVIQYASQRKQARFCSSLEANFLLLLLFSFRPRVKSASRDQVVKQEFISQSKRSPWPWDSSYHRQLSRLQNQNTLKMARRLAQTKGCFLRIFTAALAEENKSIPNGLYEKNACGRGRESW